MFQSGFTKPSASLRENRSSSRAPTATRCEGVRFFGEGIHTHSLVMTLEERQVRFVDPVHLEKWPDVKVRFH
jgi:hypothetical protein